MTNGVRLSYSMHGEGPDVVMLGPIAAPGVYWASQVSALVERGFRATTFETRGVPLSDVPPPPYTVEDLVADAASLIEALDVAPTLVVSHSLGAIVAQELALMHPELVRAAVLMGTLGRKDLTRRELGQRVLADLEANVGPRTADAVFRALTLFGRQVLADDEWMRAYLSSAETVTIDQLGAVGLQHASTAYDNRLAALAQVRVPCLVIGFEQDLLVPAALTREVANVINGAEYLKIPRCGHGGPWEQPIVINDAIISFLARRTTL
jgi:pimeloyl-ACP methyl ester carboxylesterase